MDIEIRDKKLRRLLTANGLGDIQLIRGNGYFYLTSDTNYELSIELTNCPSIYVCYYKHHTPEEWVETIKDTIKDINYNFIKE